MAQALREEKILGIKATAILAVLLLGLVGFVFLYERPRMAEEQRAVDEQEAFIEVQRHGVARLTLTNDYGHLSLRSAAMSGGWSSR